MTLFLRDEKGGTVIDCEYWIKTEDGYRFLEISSTIDVIPYSMLLLRNIDRKEEVIGHIHELSELRGWLCERYFMDRQNNPDEYDIVLKELRRMFSHVAQELDLNFVED